MVGRVSSLSKGGGGEKHPNVHVYVDSYVWKTSFWNLWLFKMMMMKSCQTSKKE